MVNSGDGRVSEPYGDVTQLEDLDLSGTDPRALFLHPGELSHALKADNLRAGLVHPLVADLEQQLTRGDQPPLVVESERPKMNARFTLTIEKATPCDDAPARSGTYSGPGLSGYRPEFIFETIVQRVKNKAKKKQAHSDGEKFSILIADMIHSQLESELKHDCYRKQFLEILRRGFGDELPYDAIAVCEPRAWGKELLTHFVVSENERISEAALNQFFSI